MWTLLMRSSLISDSLFTCLFVADSRKLNIPLFLFCGQGMYNCIELFESYAKVMCFVAVHYETELCIIVIFNKLY